MSVTFGPSTWWLRTKEAADYYARICPVGTILGDGSTVWCNAGGRAWIVSPVSTQVCTSWPYGNSTCVCPGGVELKQICCICEWPNLCSTLISSGFNPCDWFVPCIDILITSYNCRQYWTVGGGGRHWSSTESSINFARGVRMADGDSGFSDKANACSVRAFRCIRL